MLQMTPNSLTQLENCKFNNRFFQNNTLYM